MKIATHLQRPSTVLVSDLDETTHDEQSAMTPKGLDLLNRRPAIDGQELEEFLHDFVIQDLVALSLNLELLVGRANSLIGRIRNVVDGRHQQHTLEDVISIASASFDGLATCAIQVHPASNMLLDHTLLIDVSCVIRECVANAVRHGHAGQVKISAQTSDDELELVVEDDGVGIDERSIATGNGTRNIAARAMRRGGSCRIVRLPAGGTKVTWKASTKETQT